MELVGALLTWTIPGLPSRCALCVWKPLYEIDQLKYRQPYLDLWQTQIKIWAYILVPSSGDSLRERGPRVDLFSIRLLGCKTTPTFSFEAQGDFHKNPAIPGSSGHPCLALPCHV